MSEAGVDYWDFFTAEARRNNAPLYERFARGVAGDRELREFANTVRAGQPPANVLFAAVHFLLFRGADHPIRRFYSNLNGGKPAPDIDAAFPAFRNFVATHRDTLAPLLAARVTNTNEVGRSAILHAAFRAVATSEGRPLHLVELGPSVGLNMIWERYGVRYLAGDRTFASGATNSMLVIESELRGDGCPPLGAAPVVASRIGIELNPVDLSRAEERDWLKALLWPDQIGRFARLEAALEIRMEESPVILKGSALDLLPEVLSEIPERGALCVYHTFVTYQFSEAQRAALDDLLITVGLRRPIWRLSWEGTLSGEAPVLLHFYHNGGKKTRALAVAHPHGAWIEWRA